MADDGVGAPNGDDLAQLRQELAEVKETLRLLAAAKPGTQQAQARADDVDDAERDLIAAARKAGVDPDQFRKAIGAAKREAFLAEYGDEIDSRVKQAVDKALDDALKEPDPDPDPNAGATGGKPAAAATAPAGGKPDGDGAGGGKPAAKPDSEPIVEHWSERSIGGMVRGGR